MMMTTANLVAARIAAACWSVDVDGDANRRTTAAAVVVVGAAAALATARRTCFFPSLPPVSVVFQAAHRHVHNPQQPLDHNNQQTARLGYSNPLTQLAVVAAT